MKKLTKHPFLIIVGIVLFLYLPIISSPGLLLERGNDLQEFFWPIIHFAKRQILENKQIPLWNNLFFSGTPLLPDPQSPLFYLPNVIFLLLPIGAAFIASFLLHILLGGIGAYLAAKRGFGFSRLSSLFTAVLYVTAPKLAGYLEAGHYGLVLTHGWLPFVLLATIKLAKKPAFRWSVLLAVSLAGLFYTHVLIFSIATLAAAVFWLSVTLTSHHALRNSLRTTHYPLLSILLTFGLITITFLPQLSWQSQTTRFLLLEAPDVYPKWTSLSQFLAAVLWPWRSTNTLDSEQWLPLGIVTTTLALVGFLHLERRTKLLLTTLVGGITLLSLNNASPFYNLLLGQDWYVLLRVATRPWFIVLLTTTFLAGYGLQVLQKKKMGRRLLMEVAILAVLELSALSWARLNIPPLQREFAPKEVYEFLQKDEERFRVFCTTRCLFQKDAAKAGRELVEGYGTLAQMNYFKHSWQLMGGYWGYYTLAIPPPGIYKFENLQPDAKSLGEYNVKYVISRHELTDENFLLEEAFGDYLVYRNASLSPRAYFLTENRQPGAEAPILQYTPNHIRVDTSSMESTQLVLAEVYSPGWKAYLDGTEEVGVQETPNALRLVDLKAITKFVDFKYQPESYKLGRSITSLTVLLLLAIYLKNKFYTST